MARPLVLVALVVLLVGVGCAATTPSPSPGPALTTSELKYRLIDEFGVPAYCDPDEYPVGRDELVAMREQFPEIERDAPTLGTIAGRLGITLDGELDDGERLAIYRAWKVLNAIVLDGPDRTFSLLVRLDPSTGTGTRVTGSIDVDGRITVTGQQAGESQMCPICLAAGTAIATPHGDVRVEDIRMGMTVWSVDRDGRRIEATVLLVGRTPVPASHRVVRLELADGRVVRASPGHPLADGRPLASIAVGDAVDGTTVVRTSLEDYAGGFTFDLLTSGPTGWYVADGIVLGSTLES